MYTPKARFFNSVAAALRFIQRRKWIRSTTIVACQNGVTLHYFEN